MKTVSFTAIAALWISCACDFPPDGPQVEPYEPPSYQWGALEGEGDVFAKAVTIDENGDVYVAGLVKGNGLLPDAEGNGPLFVTKFHGIVPQWTVQWEEGVVAALTYDGAGHLYATGSSEGYIDDEDQLVKERAIILSRLTTEGAIEWTVRWKDPETWRDAAYAITRISTGELLVAGVTGIDDASYIDPPTGGDAIVLSFSPDGSVIKEAIWGSEGTDVALALVVASDGSRYVTGYTAGTMEGQTANGGEDLFVTKLDAGGRPIWHRQIGTELDERGIAIAIDKEGAIWVIDLLTTYDNYGEKEPVSKMIAFSHQGDILYTSSSHSPNYTLAVDSTGDIFTFGNSNTYLRREEQLIDINHNYEFMEGPLLLAKWKSDGTFVGGVQWGEDYSNDSVLPAAMLIHDNTIYAVSSVSGGYTTPTNNMECSWRRCALLSMISLDK